MKKSNNTDEDNSPVQEKIRQNTSLEDMLLIDGNDSQSRLANLLVKEHEYMIQRMVAIREQKGMSQREVGKLMGYPTEVVQQLESGAPISTQMLQLYAMSIRVALEYNVVEHSEIDRFQ